LGAAGGSGGDDLRVATVARYFASPVDAPFADALAAHVARKAALRPFRAASPPPAASKFGGGDGGGEAAADRASRGGSADSGGGGKGGNGGPAAAALTGTGAWLRSRSMNPAEALQRLRSESPGPRAGPTKQRSDGELSPAAR
jgi:hypothetical protein